MEDPSLALEKSFEEIYSALPFLIGEAFSEERSPSLQLNPYVAGHDISVDIQTFRKKCSDGLIIILRKLQEEDHLQGVEKELLKAFSSLCDPSKFTMVVLKVVSGKSWREAMKIADETLERLYLGAKSIFEEGFFEQAELSFTFLAWFDSKKYESWLALGHTLYHTSSYERAIHSYRAAMFCAPEESWPHVFMASCFAAVDDNEEAVRSIKEGILLEHRKTNPDQKLIDSLEKKRDEYTRGSSVPIS